MIRAFVLVLFFAVLSLIVSIFLPISVRAADSLTVSVTPPLIQLSIGPGEFWASSLKIVNSNDREVTYYAQVVNFEAAGEKGQGKFIPLLDEIDGPPGDGGTLASWIQLSTEPIVVPAGGSFDVPFSVRIPENASPGGHYASVLIGTQPTVKPDGATVAVSSFVSSLFFVRIKGDVVEKARIREFTTEKSLYETPDGKFIVRSENQGNVHLKPRGTITIYNMWGTERGKVSINDGSHFGNVLPASVRRFEFEWSGEYSPFDVGQYSAVVALQYGDEVKQNVSATTTFWVVPVVPVSITLAVLLAIILTVTFFIRRYIRRVLELEQKRIEVVGISTHEKPHLTFEAMTRPIQEGIVDLRSTAGASVVDSTIPNVPAGSVNRERGMDTRSFFAKYRLFFIALGAFTLIFILGVWYLGEAFVSDRSFEIKNVQVTEDAA